MSPWPFLSRVLLCLALVVNAVAPVVASTHMPAAQAAPVAAHADPASEHMPCHHPRHAAVAMADAPSPATPMPDGSRQPAPDCCTSGTCSCACVHPGQAALPAMVVALERVRHRAAIGRQPQAHGAPALLHLIRPPIG